MVDRLLHERGDAHVDRAANALSRAACRLGALIDRIRQSDRSQVLAWDEVAAARSVGTYQVFITQWVHRRLRDAPPYWSARSLAASRSFGWIRLRPA
jgi:hypothetical protein